MDSTMLDCASISCEELAQLLQSGGAVVVDVRPFDDYCEQHVVSALAVRLSSLLRRRLTRGGIGLGDVICDPQRRWASKGPDAMVVVYDDAASFVGPVRYDTSLALHIVLMSLQREGLNCAFLHGGYTAFAAAQPGLVASVAPHTNPCGGGSSSSVSTRSSSAHQGPSLAGFGVPCRSPPPPSAHDHSSTAPHAPPPTPIMSLTNNAALRAHLPPGALSLGPQTHAHVHPHAHHQAHLHAHAVSRVHAYHAFGSVHQQVPQQHQQQSPAPRSSLGHFTHMSTSNISVLDQAPPYTTFAESREQQQQQQSRMGRGHVRSHSLPSSAPFPSESSGVAGIRPQQPSSMALLSPTTTTTTTRLGRRPDGGMHVHHHHHHHHHRPALALPLSRAQTPPAQTPAPTQTRGTHHHGGSSGGMMSGLGGLGSLGQSLGVAVAPPHDGRPNIKVPVSQVLDFLYLGSRREASDKALLKSLNIGYVLNMTADVPNYFPDSFQYQQVPILDTWNQHLQEYFEIAFDFITQAKAEGKAVLVHCSAGISRSAAVVIGYLMKEFCMTLNEAHQFVRSRRDIVSPNLDFMGELTDYECKLQRARELDKHLVLTAAPAISSPTFSVSHAPVA